MAEPAAQVVIDRPPPTDLFGHPRGLWVLAGTELWERISFHGMQALLTLYMAGVLLLPGRAENIVGFADYRAAVESVTGPLSTQALAAQTFGLYSGLTLATPMIGAWLGDRVLGRTRTITLGTVLMAAGHLTMASERAFLLALASMVIVIAGFIACFVGIFVAVPVVFGAQAAFYNRVLGGAAPMSSVSSDPMLVS